MYYNYCKMNNIHNNEINYRNYILVMMDERTQRGYKMSKRMFRNLKRVVLITEKYKLNKL